MKVLIIVGAVLGILVLGVVIYLGSMGMFKKMVVEEKEMGPYTHVYESFTGPYPETGKVFDKVYNELKEKGIDTSVGLGVYYDDPRKVSKEKLRSDCGIALPEKDQDKVEMLQQEFKVKVLEKQNSIVTTFPIKGSMSYMFGPMKAYSALAKYAEDKGYTISGTYELYDVPNKVIFYVATFDQD